MMNMLLFGAAAPSFWYYLRGSWRNLQPLRVLTRRITRRYPAAEA
jgi:hypothetical protein